MIRICKHQRDGTSKLNQALLFFFLFIFSEFSLKLVMKGGFAFMIMPCPLGCFHNCTNRSKMMAGLDVEEKCYGRWRGQLPEVLGGGHFLGKHWWSCRLGCERRHGGIGGVGRIEELQQLRYMIIKSTGNGEEASVSRQWRWWRWARTDRKKDDDGVEAFDRRQRDCRGWRRENSLEVWVEADDDWVLQLQAKEMDDS